MIILMGDGSKRDVTDPAVIASMLYMGGEVIRPNGTFAVVTETAGAGPADPSKWAVDGVPLLQAAAPVPTLPGTTTAGTYDTKLLLLTAAIGYLLFKGVKSLL
jgi:hypothetical protein